MKLDYENERYLTRWLDTKKENTRFAYKLGFEKFVEFAKMTPEQLIMEKWEDQKKPPPQQTDVAERRVLKFLDYLKTDYRKDDTHSRNGNVKLAPNSAILWVQAVASFYNSNGVRLNMKKVAPRGALRAHTKKVNVTVKLSPAQVKVLAYYASTLRDKALIWVLYQSGLDISSALALTWFDIMEEMPSPPRVTVNVEGKSVEVPTVKLSDNERSKFKGNRFTTFIGETAIEALKKYLIERYGATWCRSAKITDPLFLSQQGARYKAKDFRIMMRAIAPKSDIVNSRLEHADVNPLSPRSLRASFQARMKDAGCPIELVDYMAGHSVAYGGAYTNLNDENLRRQYAIYSIHALEPKEVSPQVEKQLEKIDGQQKKIEKLEKNLEDLYIRLKKYENIPAPLSELMKGGLTPRQFQNAITRLIDERFKKLMKEVREI